MPLVAALVDDLFFVSKMLETAKHTGVELKTAATVQPLLDLLKERPAALLIVDLNARQGGGAAAIEQFRAAGHTLPIVAFLSHVQTILAEQARTAGATQIMPRSLFTQTLADIFRSATS